jgi:hypothetical protein
MVVLPSSMMKSRRFTRSPRRLWRAASGNVIVAPSKAVAKPTASTPKAKRLQEIWVAETKKDALAIADHRGEILKFIGDGLLAIFPLAAFEGIADAAMNAMAAGERTFDNVGRAQIFPVFGGEVVKGE